MGGGCCSRRETPSTAEAEGKKRAYIGVRMRKWGKWVAEIREPNKRSRLWLGSYSSPVAAARAYDTAVHLLRGSSARLNFPEEMVADAAGGDDDMALSASVIRKKAAEVGARVDALQQQKQQQASSISGTPSSSRPDLNQKPSPEIAEEGTLFSS
ncbi:hypothetical protein HPP92_010580 [Vanilla planifolia]|uniref:AP2/ERF domain-containing protein n=1 Tax=Vanilla planifolia TaxID=51239 RepID=A0A835QWE6_VANPL|nr:hypothetical protein HPP92_010817 [Vanilla planifolia]KAG0482496.1 hypothetical protein HPP92_010580 [Vanilla planifolia]